MLHVYHDATFDEQKTKINRLWVNSIQVIHMVLKQFEKKNVIAIQRDVSKLDNLDQIMNEKNYLDIIFANAGVIEEAKLGSITGKHFDYIFLYQLQRCYKIVYYYFIRSLDFTCFSIQYCRIYFLIEKKSKQYLI